ncbi:MAG: hypothetical protein WDA16_01180 [Candidatus Thermoplasmatota archaeon]
MKLLTVVLMSAALVLLPGVPVASASHMGPCTHEYVEIGIYVVEHYKTNGVRQGAAYAANCAEGTVAWLCETNCNLA